MRKLLTIVLMLVSLVGVAGLRPALADCRSENAACRKGASTPFDSVACGSVYRSCAANQAQAAQQQARQRPVNQNPARPSGGTHSGRR
jgi:hypothetical protein